MSAPVSSPPMRGLCFELARVVLELTTPMAIGSPNDPEADDGFVRDASGLPAVPGTSLAGVLRHYMLARDREAAERAFGYQRGRHREPSAVEVSWGLVHGANDRPVPARLPGDTPVEDPVLVAAREGFVRDHVALGERGVVDGRQKFDHRLVPSGMRWSLELLVHRDPEDPPPVEVRELVHWMQSPASGLVVTRGVGSARFVWCAPRGGPSICGGRAIARRSPACRGS